MEGLLNSEEFRGNTELHWMERFADDRGLVDGITWPLPNVWLGTSVEDQERADERIPHLIRTPAAVRFLSCEPLLAPLDLSRWIHAPKTGRIVFSSEPTHPTGAPVTIRSDLLQWVIVGGESGSGARPFHIEWAGNLVEQCQAARVPCFVKQLGSKPYMNYYRWNDLADEFADWPLNPKIWTSDLKSEWNVDFDGQPDLDCLVRFPVRDGKGGNMNEWPDGLRVREFPRVPA